MKLAATATWTSSAWAEPKAETQAGLPGDRGAKREARIVMKQLRGEACRLLEAVVGFRYISEYIAECLQTERAVTGLPRAVFTSP